jgi:hypothetical protein
VVSNKLSGDVGLVGRRLKGKRKEFANTEHVKSSETKWRIEIRLKLEETGKRRAMWLI